MGRSRLATYVIDKGVCPEDLWGRPEDLVKPDLLDPLIRNGVLREAKTIYVATSG
jgi:hypothetical protein